MNHLGSLVVNAMLAITIKVIESYLQIIKPGHLGDHSVERIQCNNPQTTRYPNKYFDKNSFSDGIHYFHLYGRKA